MAALGLVAGAAVLAAAGLYVLIAVGLFHLGLRRYRRGQRPAS